MGDEFPVDEGAAAKHWYKDRDGATTYMERTLATLRACEWNADALEEAVRGLASDLGVGAGKLIHPLRVALTGQAASPGIFDVLVVLGRKRSLARLENALGRVRVT